MALVKLPYPGVGRFELREDQVDEELWDQVMRGYGISTLIGALA